MAAKSVKFLNKTSPASWPIYLFIYFFGHWWPLFKWGRDRRWGIERTGGTRIKGLHGSGVEPATGWMVSRAACPNHCTTGVAPLTHLLTLHLPMECMGKQIRGFRRDLNLWGEVHCVSQKTHFILHILFMFVVSSLWIWIYNWEITVKYTSQGHRDHVWNRGYIDSSNCAFVLNHKIIAWYKKSFFINE